MGRDPLTCQIMNQKCVILFSFFWQMIYNATELILIMSKDHKITSGDVENRTLVLPGLNEHAA